MNSSDGYDTNFTVVIFDDDEKCCTRRGFQPEEYYDGKTIKVTGELQRYDGPEIILYHPYQIEVIN